jgi:hypothetical protein
VALPAQIGPRVYTRISQRGKPKGFHVQRSAYRNTAPAELRDAAMKGPAAMTGAANTVCIRFLASALSVASAPYKAESPTPTRGCLYPWRREHPTL